MGRSEKPIDWEKVDEMLIAGLEGTEIAPVFDLHPNTFYDRVAQKYNIRFTEYQQAKRSIGDGLIRAKQFYKAIKKDDNQMLIWLGKNRLKQSDSPIEKVIAKAVEEKFEIIMQSITGSQSELNKDQMSNNTECKSEFVTGENNAC